MFGELSLPERACNQVKAVHVEWWGGRPVEVRPQPDVFHSDDPATYWMERTTASASLPQTAVSQ